jgi:hypothetical protein
VKSNAVATLRFVHHALLEAQVCPSVEISAVRASVRTPHPLALIFHRRVAER